MHICEMGCPSKISYASENEYAYDCGATKVEQCFITKEALLACMCWRSGVLLAKIEIAMQV